ncbi:branched-chain amino acid ABC transporter substrate-binding protein [Sorangium cellulosum]|uniref:Branched-chain amino acid ABC transporter substrate-binding protein n=1 Tax=Sorangium cellulosum TaxID=56 RepID=A0A2L0F1I8_SORCE|nr:ABC transporter substrate-binding protein [Sorangium cellulosum]AUX45434.1 branched-chain amino acid ABC transporter substrate-binding protein [Sorangium cellulosum]
MHCIQTGLLVGLASLLPASCTPAAPEHPEDAVRIGGLLPFSGSESAIGRNLEQAMLLATSDLNAAGGLDGRPFDLVLRDSHSSTQRGLDQLIELLYTDAVNYLVGPEENQIALDIAPDVKKRDVLHMLPGYAAPFGARSDVRGGSIRLAPSPFAVGCVLARSAEREGVESVNSLAALDDYNSRISIEFTTIFGTFGRVLPSVTFTPGEQTYTDQIESAFASHAGRTLLAAFPAAASTIVTEWTGSGRPGTWFLGPALRTEELLANIPAGALDGYLGVSPSLSLRSECRVIDEDEATVDCTTGNADVFIGHFSRQWDGEVPLPAAHFYYDGVVLIAMGLAYAQATSGAIPSSGYELRNIIHELSDPDHEAASWRDLGAAMAKLRAGIPVRYVGAAAEYEFDVYGTNQHHFLQTWTVDGDTFVDLATVPVPCTPRL